jgi:hypothetical protein
MLPSNDRSSESVLCLVSARRHTKAAASADAALSCVLLLRAGWRVRQDVPACPVTPRSRRVLPPTLAEGALFTWPGAEPHHPIGCRRLPHSSDERQGACRTDQIHDRVAQPIIGLYIVIRVPLVEPLLSIQQLAKEIAPAGNPTVTLQPA